MSSIEILELLCLAILLIDGFLTVCTMHRAEFGGWCSLFIYLWALVWYCLQPETLLTAILLVILVACAIEHRRRGVNGVLS